MEGVGRPILSGARQGNARSPVPGANGPARAQLFSAIREHGLLAPAESHAFGESTPSTDCQGLSDRHGAGAPRSGCPPSACHASFALCVTGTVRDLGARPGGAGLLRFLESVHTRVPLQGDDRAFDRLQQPQRHDQARRRPDRQMRREGRRELLFRPENQRNQHVSDDHDHEVGWKIVSAVMMKFLAARSTTVGDLQEGTEQPALSAGRALAPEPA